MLVRIIAPKRRKPQSGGLRVIRRGWRKYVVIPPHGAEPRKAEAKGTEGAKIADGKEKQNESV